MRRAITFTFRNSRRICSSGGGIACRGSITLEKKPSLFEVNRPVSSSVARTFSTSRHLFLGNSATNVSTAVKNEKEELTMEEKLLKNYSLPAEQPVVTLDCDAAFNNLSNQEKLYAHYLSQACWVGGLVAAVQTSVESPVILAVLIDMFQTNGVDEVKNFAMTKCGFTDDDWKAFTVYVTGVYGNCGNYKSFGDTKIIPTLSQDKFESLVNTVQVGNAELREAFKEIKDRVYSLSERERQLGLGENGISTYFSDNCTMEDAELLNRFLKTQGVEAYITRAFKTIKDGVVHYEIRSASVEDSAGNEAVHDFESTKIRFTRGDYSPLLKSVVKYLEKAKEHAANDTEKKMLDSYMESFQKGSLQAHIEGSKHWVHDQQPAIETYIGFIETYRDPSGCRGEFEGFVAVVNRPMSAKFQVLVDNAKEFLPLLPWPNTFERETFVKPDFTSLDVLTFAGSGIPAGINIPNYDTVRQDIGSKNVSLGNVIPASYKDQKIPFVSAEDKAFMDKYRIPAFEVQVGLHELLGHGSGKLLMNKDGKPNYSPDLRNPLTNQLIEKVYEEGDSYDSVFTNLGSAYEECRAESVGIYLSLSNDVLKIFGHEGQEAEEIKYTNWLNMVFAGVRSLELYQPTTKIWSQAHSQARFVILQVLLEAGDGLVTVTEQPGDDGKPDLLINLDGAKIDTVGRKAMADFLLKIQVYKSTADIQAARSMFDKYSAVHDDGPLPWASWREIVMDKKQPRKLFVQHNTVPDGDSVAIKSYVATPEGMIQSWIDRYQKDDDVAHGLGWCYKKDKSYFLKE